MATLEYYLRIKKQKKLIIVPSNPCFKNYNNNILQCGNLVGQTREQEIFYIRVIWKGVMDIIFELSLRRFVRLIHTKLEVTKEEECKVSWGQGVRNSSFLSVLLLLMIKWNAWEKNNVQIKIWCYEFYYFTSVWIYSVTYIYRTFEKGFRH